MTTNSIPSLRRILVHMDDTARSVTRLTFARRIAQEFECELLAAYVTSPGYVLVPYAPASGGQAFTLLREMDEDRVRAARARFDEAMAHPGAAASWTTSCEAPAEQHLSLQAIYADLLVLGQHDASDPQSSWMPRDTVEFVIGTSGRPALVLPHSGELPTRLDTIAIAWKATREAARAVAAAIPFLQRARRVVVLAWDEDEAAAREELHRLEQYLLSHGVASESHYEGPQDPQTGEFLLSCLSEFDAQLLVMGCYGHSRAREWVLGGTTRTIFSSMTVPVLMAH